MIGASVVSGVNNTDGKEALRRFRPYPAYKESGVEWLGKIPAHWAVAPVYARYEVALGKMLDGKRVTGEFSARYLRNIDVQWDAVNTEGLPEMDFAPWERDRYGLQPGDLLVCEGGEVGRTAIWSGAIDQCFYQKAIHRVRPRSSHEQPRFFFYLMYTLAKRGVFVAGGNANTIDHLTAVQLRHYRLPFAPLGEQSAIAAFLDRETARIDALVAKKELLIELLQEKRAALITRAVTKGLDPNVRMKDSGIEWLGEIPAHWENGRLRRFWSVIDCKHRTAVYVDDGLAIVSTTEVKPGRLLLDGPRKVAMADFDDLTGGGRRPQRGDIIYSRNASLGSAAYVETDEPFCMGQDVCLVTSEGDQLYLAYQLNSPVVLGQIEAVSVGSTFERINVAQIKDYMVACPPCTEQACIATFLDRETAKIDALVAKVRDAIDRLNELRSALISAAVTGKIDVRGEVE